jgi:hypothetical protein
VGKIEEKDFSIEDRIDGDEARVFEIEAEASSSQIS